MDRLLDVPFDRLHVRPRRVAAVHVAVQLGQLLVVPGKEKSANLPREAKEGKLPLQPGKQLLLTCPHLSKKSQSNPNTLLHSPETHH